VLVQVITGTTREGRFSERVAQWVVEHLAAREDLAWWTAALNTARAADA
jgi:NAD(P)H-dependent FMN reductase